MLVAQFGIRRGGCLGQGFEAGGEWFLHAEVARGGNEKRGRLRVFDADRLPEDGCGFSIGKDAQRGGESDAIGAGLSGDADGIVSFLEGLAVERPAAKIGVEIQPRFAATLDADDEGVGRCGNEIFEFITAAVDFVADVDDGGFHVEPAPVIFHGTVRIARGENEFAERLVGMSVARRTGEAHVGEIFRLADLPRRQQVADFLERGPRIGILPLHRSAVPDRFLVERNALRKIILLFPRSAVDHRAEPTVSQGQRFLESLCGLPVPKAVAVERSGRVIFHGMVFNKIISKVLAKGKFID